MMKNAFIPRNELVEMNKEINKVRAKVEKELMKYPGVVSVGVGLKEVDGKVKKELCFKVTVLKKKPLKALKKSERIPESIYGFKTDVEEMSASVPLAIDNNHYRPLIGGTQVSNFYATGTLGCLARRVSDNKVVGLSNWHVLVSNVSEVRNEPIGQPGGCNLCPCCVCNKIGNTVDGVLDPRMDAAIVLLDGQENGGNPKHRYINEIVGIGVVTGSDPAIPGETIYKRGRTTRLTKGIILNDSSTFPVSYGFNDHHTVQFVDQLTLSPIPGTMIDMSDGGDSGSVVVNEHNKVVGLLFAGQRNGPNARASKIGPILTQFGITIPDGSYPNYTDKIGVPLGGASVSQSPILTFQESFELLEEELKKIDLGALLIKMGRKHSHEALSLVNNNREVTVGWHRYEGPQFLSNIIRSIRRGKPIPEQINGISLQNLMIKMTSLLKRHGSDSLKEDIENQYLTIMEIFGAGNTVEDWKLKLAHLDVEAQNKNTSYV